MQPRVDAATDDAAMATRPARRTVGVRGALAYLVPEITPPKPPLINMSALFGFSASTFLYCFLIEPAAGAGGGCWNSSVLGGEMKKEIDRMQEL